MLELLGCVLTCTGTSRAFCEPDGQNAGVSFLCEFNLNMLKFLGFCCELDGQK